MGIAGTTTDDERQDTELQPGAGSADLGHALQAGGAGVAELSRAEALALEGLLYEAGRCGVGSDQAFVQRVMAQLPAHCAQMPSARWQALRSVRYAWVRAVLRRLRCLVTQVMGACRGFGRSLANEMTAMDAPGPHAGPRRYLRHALRLLMYDVLACLVMAVVVASYSVVLLVAHGSPQAHPLIAALLMAVAVVIAGAIVYLACVGRSPLAEGRGGHGRRHALITVILLLVMGMGLIVLGSTGLERLLWLI